MRLPDIDDEELDSIAEAAVEVFKVPSLVEFTTEPLPRTPSGKILKTVLRGGKPAVVAGLDE